MRIEAGGADGPAQGKRKRIHEVVFRFFQSIGIEFYSSAGGIGWEAKPWRSSDDAMDEGLSLYTGDKTWPWDGTWETDGQIRWRQADPLPSNILLIAAKLETQDGG